MPGPTTEVLGDDRKDVRTDLHKVEMALTAEIHKVDNSVAKLGAEFAALKWLLGATLATTLSGIIGSAYWAGSLASRVTGVESRLDKSDGRLDRIDGRLDQMNDRFGKLDGRLERIEALLLKGLPPPDPGRPPTPGR